MLYIKLKEINRREREKRNFYIPFTNKRELETLMKLVSKLNEMEMFTHKIAVKEQLRSRQQESFMTFLPPPPPLSATSRYEISIIDRNKISFNNSSDYLNDRIFEGKLLLNNLEDYKKYIDDIYNNEYIAKYNVEDYNDEKNLKNFDLQYKKDLYKGSIENFIENKKIEKKEVFQYITLEKDSFKQILRGVEINIFPENNFLKKYDENNEIKLDYLKENEIDNYIQNGYDYNKDNLDGNIKIINNIDTINKNIIKNKLDNNGLLSFLHTKENIFNIFFKKENDFSKIHKYVKKNNKIPLNGNPLNINKNLLRKIYNNFKSGDVERQLEKTYKDLNNKDKNKKTNIVYIFNNIDTLQRDMFSELKRLEKMNKKVYKLKNIYEELKELKREIKILYDINDRIDIYYINFCDTYNDILKLINNDKDIDNKLKKFIKELINNKQ